jgi:hypothetical protein
MSFGVTVNIAPGVGLTLGGETLDAVLEQWQKAGGDPKFLLRQCRATVQAAEANAKVPTSSAVSAPSESASVSANEDPWADDGGESTDGEDPWADDSYAAPGSSQRPAQNAADPKTTIDKFKRQWTVGLPDAPNCGCGIPAARVRGKSQSTGKPYTMWKCAKAPTEQWSSKCNFSEFPN